MTEIPRPEALDPQHVVGYDRDTLPVTGDLRGELRTLRHHLDDTFAYASQLWDRLDAVREYLAQLLPPNPGFTDERAWQDWTQTYASVVSTLLGPRGDSGFAMDEARRLVRNSREFPPDSTPTQETVVGEASDG